MARKKILSSRWSTATFFILSILVLTLAYTIVLLQNSTPTNQQQADASLKTCLPRPACLDATNPCKLPERNWCPPAAASVTPPLAACGRCDAVRPYICTNARTQNSYCLPFPIGSRDFVCTKCPSTGTVSPSIHPSISPVVSCVPRPACLDANPRCLIAEPAHGWCPAQNQ